MKVSIEAIKEIEEFEGTGTKKGDRYYVYLDPISLPTIGIGHLLTEEELRTRTISINGVPVRYEFGLTKQQMEDLKIQDLDEAGRQMMRLVKVPLNQFQYDALTSFCFNLGQGNLGKSTLLRKLNNNDYKGAAAEFLKWNKAGGKVLNGLVRRREWESKWFMKTEITKQESKEETKVETKVEQPQEKPETKPSKKNKDVKNESLVATIGRAVGVDV